MFLSNITPLLQIITVASFSYSINLIRDPLNNIFKKSLGLFDSLDEKLDSIIENVDKTLIGLSTINDSISSNKKGNKSMNNIQYDLITLEKESKGLHADIDDYHKKAIKVNYTERCKLQFYKKLPSAYLMSAIYGVFILFLISVHSILDIKNLVSILLFVSLMVTLFYVYFIISTVKQKGVRIPSLINILMMFIFFMFLSFLLLDFIKRNLFFFDPIIDTRKLLLISIILTLSSFSFIFHFLRPITIKISYFLCRFKNYIRLMFGIRKRKVILIFKNWGVKKAISIFNKD